MRHRFGGTCIATLLTGITVSTGCAAVRPARGPMVTGTVPSVESSPAAQGIIEARMLVRRAWMTVVTEEVGSVAERATALADELGGYVQTSREGTDDEMTMTIRVPSAMLDGAMDSIAALGEVESRRVAADDVTEQVIDLDGRVASLRATRDRLRALLSSASGISEVITVERELQRVQADLESLERRLIHLRGSSALADLTIDAHRPRKPGVVMIVAEFVGSAVEWLFVRR